MRLDKFAIPQPGQQVPVSRETADRIGQLEDDRVHPARSAQFGRIEGMQAEIGELAHQLDRRVQCLAQAGHDAAATHVDRTGHGDEIDDARILPEPRVHGRQKPTETPAHH